VDPLGKTVRCRTKNLDHVKVMQVEEWVMFSQTPEGYGTLFYVFIFEINKMARKTLQTTEARILSGFGWGLTKRIENHGLSRFKANVQRVCALPMH
jgi:PRELI-like family